MREGLKIRPLLLVYYTDDIKYRPEKAKLIYASLQKVMPEAVVSIEELPGKHCSKLTDENGEPLLMSKVIAFLEDMSKINPERIIVLNPKDRNITC